MTHCVLYHFYENSADYADNFRHFLEFGCEGHDVICVLSSDVSFPLPQRNNIRYITAENKNYDYGGFSHIIGLGMLTAYDHVVFINSSVRGPYTPPWQNMNWTDAYLDHLRRDANVGLVGSSINVLPNTSKYAVAYRERHGGDGLCAHVQSYAFALSKKALQTLCDDKFFSFTGELSKDKLIVDYEIHMSQLLIKKGYAIKCLMPEYNRLDFKALTDATACNPTANGGDPSFKFAYFGRTPHPYETVFAKANRSIYPAGFLEALSFSMLCAKGSPPDLLFGQTAQPQTFLKEAETQRIPALWRDVYKLVWKKIDPKRLRKKRIKTIDR